MRAIVIFERGVGGNNAGRRHMALDHGIECRRRRGWVEIEIYSTNGGWPYCATLICFPVIPDALSQMINEVEASESSVFELGCHHA